MKEGFFKKYKTEIFIFSLALVARGILFFINLHTNGGDLDLTIHGQDGYYDVAKSLVNGDGFSAWKQLPTPFHVPIYPLFLASFLFLFGSFAPAVAVQVLISSFIPLLGRKISLKIFPSEKIALWVGIALALEPYLVLFSYIFYSETFFIFIFLYFILTIFKYLEDKSLKTLSFAAFILGISVLTKTVLQFLPIFLIPFLWWSLRKDLSKKNLIKHFAVFIFIFLIILSPWVYRNYKTFGVPGLTIMPVFNLYTCLVPSVLSIENHTNFATEQRAFIEERGIDINDITPKTAPKYRDEAISVIKEHPVALVKVSAINVFTFFTHDGMLTFLGNLGISPKFSLEKPAIVLLLSSPLDFIKTISKFIYSPFVLVLLMRIFWILITLLFIIGIIFVFKDRKFNKALIVSLIIIFYFTITTPSNGLAVNARFRMPVEPIVFAISFLAISETIQKFRKSYGK